MWRAFSRSRQASTPRRRCHGLTEETGSWEGTPGDDPKLVLDDPPPRHQQIPWDLGRVPSLGDRFARVARVTGYISPALAGSSDRLRVLRQHL